MHYKRILFCIKLIGIPFNVKILGYSTVYNRSFLSALISAFLTPIQEIIYFFAVI